MSLGYAANMNGNFFFWGLFSFSIRTSCNFVWFLFCSSRSHNGMWFTFRLNTLNGQIVTSSTHLALFNGVTTSFNFNRRVALRDTSLARKWSRFLRIYHYWFLPKIKRKNFFFYKMLLLRCAKFYLLFVFFYLSTLFSNHMKEPRSSARIESLF